MPGKKRVHVKAEDPPPAGSPSQAGSHSSSKDGTAGATLETGINSTHYSLVQDALNIIESIEDVKGIRGCQPLQVKDGAALAPFDATVFKGKMAAGEHYLCGHNVFLANPLRDASPGVPIGTAEVYIMRQHFFSNVFNL